MESLLLKKASSKRETLCAGEKAIEEDGVKTKKMDRTQRRLRGGDGYILEL